MTRRQNKILKTVTVICLILGVSPVVQAMHIMEGYLPPAYCIGWGIICVPFLLAGYFSIKKTVSESRKTLAILAMAGAFIFVISSLKIPSVTGSSSHMTGTGLGTILFGPSAVSILGIIVLIFQAIILAHGGITTLGANTFSMAIAGPFVAFGVYMLCKKIKINRYVGFFLAVLIGNIFTYMVTSIQLALAYPAESGGMMASAVKFLAVFAPTQLPLAVVEGILTVIIMMALETYAKSEMKSLGFEIGGIK